MKWIKRAGLVGFLLALSYQSVPAMDWQDPDWKKWGCPNELSGTWIAESTSALSGQEIDFRRDQTILLVREGRDQIIPFRGDLKPGKNSAVEIEVDSPENAFPRYWKIKVRLGPVKEGITGRGHCRIKVFRYDTPSRRKQNRETNWDIYSRRD